MYFFITASSQLYSFVCLLSPQHSKGNQSSPVLRQFIQLQNKCKCCFPSTFQFYVSPVYNALFVVSIFSFNRFASVQFLRFFFCWTLYYHKVVVVSTHAFLNALTRIMARQRNDYVKETTEIKELMGDIDHEKVQRIIFNQVICDC